MLNTFQNYSRHNHRQEERELHLRTIEALAAAIPDDDYEEPSFSLTDGILRTESSNTSERSPTLSLLRAHKRRVLLIIVTSLASIIALGVSFSARKAPNGVAMVYSRNRLLSMIQDWNATRLEQLEDHQSPPARALDWILSMDGEMDFDRIDLLKEKFALATLFFATNGDLSWTNRDGWLSLESSCSWYGVTCTGVDGPIHRLDLSMNGLQSSIPAELALLNLESLGLYANTLDGTIPKEVYRMTDLAYLYLDSNHLSGQIDSAIGSLTNLLDLRLSGNMLTGLLPGEIERLNFLQIAYIDGNELYGTLPSSAIAKLVFLHELQIHDNLFFGNLPRELNRLKMLRVLYCDDNIFSGAIPDSLGQLPRLEALFLFENQLAGPIPKAFSQLTSLKEFEVHGNQLSGPLWEDVVAKWTNLEIFQVHNNLLDGMVPSSLAHLEELRIIELQGNLFVGTVPVSFCNATALTTLNSDCNDRMQCSCCSQCYHN